MTNRENPIHRIKSTSDPDPDPDPNQNYMDPKHWFKGLVWLKDWVQMMHLFCLEYLVWLKDWVQLKDLVLLKDMVW